MEIIRTSSLVYKYSTQDEDTPALALNGIDLNIKKGSFTAVLGRNGSGKSTLAKHINALLLPTEGTIWVNGIDTNDRSRIWDVRQSAGMVFQNPDNQIIASIVEEDVAFGPENMGIPPDKIRTRVDEAIDAVGMKKFIRSAPHHLSGGQKQRVAIAGVLAMKPSCIVLDEPTTMLDPSGRHEVINTVMRLNKEEGISVILITHFMEEAVLADRVIVIEKGKIMMDGLPRKIFKNITDLKNIGLDVPQATELAHLLNTKANANLLPDDLLTMGELTDALLTASNLTTNPLISECTEDTALSIPQKPANETPETSRNLLHDHLLEVKNISYLYGQGSTFEKKALNDVSLSIARGEFIGLIGHTGSGKSTLIQHFNALLKPTSGQVFFDGSDIHADKTKLKSIRQQVGLVFQYPEHQLFEMTVLKDVSFGPTNLGLPDEVVKERAIKALTDVGIDSDLFDKSPFELSGGQRRRAAIAGVLAMQPKILVLDEPTAGLDPKGRDEILEQIKYMHSNLQLTVVLVTHSMEDVAKLAQRIIVINQGHIEYDGVPGEVFSHVNELESMGLAAPQTTYLMRDLRSAGWDVSDRVFTLPETAEIIFEWGFASRD